MPKVTRIFVSFSPEDTPILRVKRIYVLAVGWMCCRLTGYTPPNSRLRRWMISYGLVWAYYLALRRQQFADKH